MLCIYIYIYVCVGINIYIYRERVKYVFTFIAGSHIYFKDILLGNLMPFYKKGVKGRCSNFWIRTDPEKSSFSPPQRAEMRKGAKPSCWTAFFRPPPHFNIKSETEFWQACYFLQCQEPHNRPFFWTMLLKCFKIQMYWVTKLYKYSTPIPAGALARSFGKSTVFSVCLAEGKKYFN